MMTNVIAGLAALGCAFAALASALAGRTVEVPLWIIAGSIAALRADRR